MRLSWSCRSTRGFTAAALRIHGRHASFGLPNLKTPEDCAVIALRAARECDGLVERAAAGASHPSVDSLMALDTISNTLCGVLDTMEVARNVHPHAAFIEAADEAYNTLGERLAEINTDDRLHRAVAAVLDDSKIASSLSTEQRRFATAMRAEFEHDGAHLGACERGQLRALQAEEARHAQRFVSGATARGSPRSDVWAPTEALRSVLPERAVSAFAASGDRTLVPADRATLTAALEAVACERTRRELYLCREELARSNLPSLHALLATRHAIATTLGAPSYAIHRLSHDRMETSPGAVSGALRRLSRRLDGKVSAELELMLHAKRRLAGRADATTVLPWDVTYLMAQCRAEALSADADADVSPYFELEASLAGLRDVLTRAFGLSLDPIPAAEGELWHGSVRKMLLSAAAGGPGSSAGSGAGCGAGSGVALGVLYLDLFPRARKTTQAGLYTLRSAHASGAADARGAADDRCPLRRHLPAAVLVASLPEPRGAGCDPRSGLALLQHRQLEKTLYHEMGHAIHALVSRTETQHFAGTRVPLDFVEAPALLMERFASDPRVLATWARHHTTREPLPAELAGRINASSRLFVGLEAQHSCLHAMADLELHGAELAGGNDIRLGGMALRKLAEEHTSLPFDRGIGGVGGADEGDVGRGSAGDEGSAMNPSWHGAFRHLASYGTGYYTYLWAQSISSRVWQQCFAAEPLRREVGERWRSAVLAHGGAREPRALLRDMLSEDSRALGQAGRVSGSTGAASEAVEQRTDPESVELAIRDLVPGLDHSRGRASE